MASITFQGVLIEHLKHAGFKISDGKVTVYIDPFQVEGAPRDGDVIICTHDHYDHCSPDDIAKLAKRDATLVASPNCTHIVERLGFSHQLLKAGEKAEIKGVLIEAVPAYNIRRRFHPRGYGGIGVIVSVGGIRVYHAGDTDRIPEMKQLKGRVDVALLPVSGTYVMTADEAADAALDIQPRLAIPMHYGVIVGSHSDAEHFKKRLEGRVSVEIV